MPLRYSILFMVCLKVFLLNSFRITLRCKLSRLPGASLYPDFCESHLHLIRTGTTSATWCDSPDVQQQQQRSKVAYTANAGLLRRLEGGFGIITPRYTPSSVHPSRTPTDEPFSVDPMRDHTTAPSSSSSAHSSLVCCAWRAVHGNVAVYQLQVISVQDADARALGYVAAGWRRPDRQ